LLFNGSKGPKIAKHLSPRPSRQIGRSRSAKLRRQTFLWHAGGQIDFDGKKFVIEKSHHRWEEFSMVENIMVFDCDGHIIESIPEMVPYLDAVDRECRVIKTFKPIKKFQSFET
jgi:hypothetical protein